MVSDSNAEKPICINNILKYMYILTTNIHSNVHIMHCLLNYNLNPLLEFRYTNKVEGSLLPYIVKSILKDIESTNKESDRFILCSGP